MKWTIAQALGCLGRAFDQKLVGIEGSEPQIEEVSRFGARLILQ